MVEIVSTFVPRPPGALYAAYILMRRPDPATSTFQLSATLEVVVFDPLTKRAAVHGVAVDAARLRNFSSSSIAIWLAAVDIRPRPTMRVTMPDEPASATT